MRIIRLGRQTLHSCELDCVRCSWTHWLTLQLHGLALLLGLSSAFGIGLDAGEELFSRSRQGNVLDTDVDSLLDVSVADFLVDDDADGGAGHVVDDAGLAVVDFVWHTLLDCAVGFDVDDITDSICFHVRAESDHALLAMLAAERIARAGAKTCGVTHGDG